MTTRENLIERARTLSKKRYWSSQSNIWAEIIENLETEKDIKVGYWLGFLRPTELLSNYFKDDAGEQFLDLHYFLIAVSEFYEER